MTDAAIIQLFWERAETAVKAASEAYGGYCYRIAYNILCVNEDSEELYDIAAAAGGMKGFDSSGIDGIYAVDEEDN